MVGRARKQTFHDPPMRGGNPSRRGETPAQGAECLLRDRVVGAATLEFEVAILDRERYA